LGTGCTEISWDVGVVVCCNLERLLHRWPIMTHRSHNPKIIVADDVLCGRTQQVNKW